MENVKSVSEFLKRNFLVEVEGIKNKIYKCSSGFPTIGIGHKLTQSEVSSGKIIINGISVKYWKRPLTLEEIYQLEEQDLSKFEYNLKSICEYLSFHYGTNLTQYQYDALISFSFNIGSFAFKKSTLYAKLINTNFNEVPDQMRRWVYGNIRGTKIKIKGLEIRREKEIKLWNGEYEWYEKNKN